MRNLTLFSYVYSAQLEKQLVYHQLSVVRLVTAVLAMVVTLAMARAGAGVWSLLGREVVLSGAALVGNRLASRWRYHGGYNPETALRLWRFGWQMFVTRGLETLWYRADTALLGILGGTVVLGFYDRGRYLAEFGHYIVSFGAVQVAYPVYARLQGRPEAVAYAYRLTHGFLVRLMFPVLIWLLLFPRELVGLLYGAGQRWDETAAILPWLAVFGFLYPIADNVKVLLIGIGRIRDAVKFRVVQLCVTLPLLAPAILHWGAPGAGAVMTLSEIVGLGSSYLSLRAEIGSLALGGYLRPAIAAAVGGRRRRAQPDVACAPVDRTHGVRGEPRRVRLPSTSSASRSSTGSRCRSICLALIGAFQGETPLAPNGAPGAEAAPEITAADPPAGPDVR